MSAGIVVYFNKSSNFWGQLLCRQHTSTNFHQAAAIVRLTKDVCEGPLLL